MPVCYRLVAYEYDPGHVPPLLRVTCTTSPPGTSIRQVIRAAFPGVQPAEPVGGFLDWILSSHEEIALAGQLPPEEELEGLLALMTGALTVQDKCEVSHCLDFYRYPVETAETPEEWEYTRTGLAVYRAKYCADQSAGHELQDDLIDFASNHPALAGSEGVAAMPPSSDHGNRPDWPALWARAIAEALGARPVPLRRARPTRPQKGIEDRDERARNQRGSMVADATAAGRCVLVVDDLYTQGDSMEEAARALRDAGSAVVFGLCTVKTVKGCQGYPF